jgi:quercetin dioxygenase-like cupin family protein
MYHEGSIDKQPVDQRGYFVGAFLPEGHPSYSEKVEVAWQKLSSKTEGKKHYHKEMAEIIIVFAGRLKIEVDGDLLGLGPKDFVFIKAGAISETKAIEDGTVVMLIKAPSIPSDKYLVEK